MFLKKDFLYTLLIFIIAFLLTSDLFFRDAQPTTFDGRTHITQMAQYYIGLSQGQFPVTWADGFANYGMPIPIIAQQTINYAGALINFITQDIRTAHNLVYLLGAFLSSWFFYRFLRFYFNPDLAFLGAFLFNFSSYRIINIYIRGALPEFFAAVFIPLSLIALYWLSKDKIKSGLALFIFSTAMIIFTHPFMFIISLFLIIPYAIFLLLQLAQKRRFLILSALGFGLGVGVTAVYMVPLFLEIKYFYYSTKESFLIPNQYLTLQSYFDPNWYYYFRNDVFVRGNFIQFGLIESIIVVLGFVATVITGIRKKLSKNKILVFSSSVSILLIFFTSALSAVFYENISLLEGIQYPWRLLGVFIFIPPLIICYLLKDRKYQGVLIVIIVLLISVARFPELYGKNFTVYPQSAYFFTTENHHGVILNTIWTGKSEDYPIQREKPAVIDGKGTVEKKEVKNGYREYHINAETPLRMVDYTFYFPGWNVYVNGQPAVIEYQDPKYRGVITYNLPQGSHDVKLQFEPTKIRMAGATVTIVVLFVIGALLFAIDRIPLVRKVL